MVGMDKGWYVSNSIYHYMSNDAFLPWFQGQIK